MVDKTTGNNQMPNSDLDEGNASEKYVTVEQVNQIIHAAMTARNRAFESKLDEKFSRLEGLLQPKQEEESAPKGKKLTPEMEAMQNQLNQLRNERVKARDMQLRTAVKEQLLKAGVNPAAVKALVAMHVDADKTIGYAGEESDEILYRGSDSHFTLEQGLGTWLKSDEAKIYLAPKGAAGSGDRPYHNNTTNNFSGKSGKPSRSEVGNYIAQALTGLPSSPSEDE